MHTIPHLVLANAAATTGQAGAARAALTVLGSRRRAANTRQSCYPHSQRHGRLRDRSLGTASVSLSYNTPEWVIFDVAAMAVGAVPVGIYFSSSAEEIADVLEQSAARRIVLAGTDALADKEPTPLRTHPSMWLSVSRGPGQRPVMAVVP